MFLNRTNGDQMSNRETFAIDTTFHKIKIAIMSTKDILHHLSESSGSSSFDNEEDLYVASSEESRVRFSPQVDCMGTITRHEYTYSEARSSWLFPDEKAAIMGKHAKTAQRMKSGKKPKKNSTYRGLETMNAQDVFEMKTIINACVNAVLDEQDAQWGEDIFLWGRFSKISRRCSKDSKKLAIKRAKSDEREAKKAYRQMEAGSDESSQADSNSSSSAECVLSPQKTLTYKRTDPPGKILLKMRSPLRTGVPV